MKILIFRTVAHQMSIGSYNSQEIGMAKAFVQMRHDCDVIYFTWKQNRDVDLLELDNHKARLLWRRGIPLIRTGIYPKMASKKFLNNYDLIITNEYNQLMSLIVCKNHTFGKTFVYNGPYYNMFKISFMEKVYDSLFKKSFRENCDWFLAKSVLSERYLNDRGIVNIDTVGVALDVTKFDDKIELSSETLALIDYLKDNECLLYVGSLSERKNFPFLLEMFNELCQINDEIKLVVVGSGDKKFVNKCISNIDKNSEERIKFIERIPNSELPKVYSECVGFILPSIKEIFGMVILEAMYFGCNVYSSATGGALTLIKNNENGYVFNNFDSKNWASKINKTIGADKRKKIGIAANKTIIENYTWPIIATRILDRFEKVSRNENE